MSLDIEAGVKQIEDAGIFLGSDRRYFFLGYSQLVQLLEQGLQPSDTVLDIGCGCLRGGLWTIRLLDPACYYGIEPNRAMLDAGIKAFVDKELMNFKKPSFSYNDDFDFSVFSTKFDFFIAGSIWTHAAPAQINKMLRSFKETSTSKAKFLTTAIVARPWQQNYSGADWIGKSHKSSVAGVARYTARWLCERVEKHQCRISFGKKTRNQTWLIIERK